MNSAEKIPLDADDLLINSRLNESIVAATAALMIRMDTWGIIYATPKACKLFGYMKGELDGKPLEILIPDDKRSVHTQHTADFMKKPQGRPMGEIGMVLQGKCKDGKIIPVAISLEPEVLMGVPVVTANILLTHA